MPVNWWDGTSRSLRNLDAAVNEIRAHGIAVTDPKPVGTGRQAFVHDPSGNLVELNEPLPTSAK